MHKGKKRVKFRFRDSPTTGGYKSAGTSEDGDIIVGDFTTGEFAGTVCVRTISDDSQSAAHAFEHVGADAVDNERCRSDFRDGTPSLPGIQTQPCYIRAERVVAHGCIRRRMERIALRIFALGVESSSPQYLVSHEPTGSLFFSAKAEPFGRELWRFQANDVGPSEGNLSPRNGTVSVALIEGVRTGEIGSDPQYLTIRDPNSAVPSLSSLRQMGCVAASCGLVKTASHRNLATGRVRQHISSRTSGQVRLDPRFPGLSCLIHTDSQTQPPAFSLHLTEFWAESCGKATAQNLGLPWFETSILVPADRILLISRTLKA